MQRKARLLLATFLPVVFAAVQPAGRAQPTKPDVSVTAMSEGERLFQMHCASCHGTTGHGGRGPALAVPKLNRARTEEALMKIIRSGIAGTEMPRFRLVDDELHALAEWVIELGRLPPEHVPGDPQRGAALYSGKGACAQCHAINGRGSAIGPDLTEIGLRRSAAYLRTALVDPNADVPRSTGVYRQDVSLSENFLMVRAVLKDGQTIAGVRVNEDTFSIQIRDLTNRIHSYYKSELAELHKDWGQSIMPPYRGVFTDPELDDLVAYLASLKGEL